MAVYISGEFPWHHSGYSLTSQIEHKNSAAIKAQLFFADSLRDPVPGRGGAASAESCSNAATKVSSVYGAPLLSWIFRNIVRPGVNTLLCTEVCCLSLSKRRSLFGVAALTHNAMCPEGLCGLGREKQKASLARSEKKCFAPVYPGH